MAPPSPPRERPTTAPRLLLLLVSGAFLLETATIAVVLPMVPLLVSTVGITPGEGGLLTSFHQLAAFAAALALVLAAPRLAVKRLTIMGLLGLAAGCAAFAVVDGFAPLLMARMLQGASGAACWIGGLAWLTAQVEAGHRGEALGFAMAATSGGALLGPLLGTSSDSVGRDGAFLGMAVLAVGLAVAAVTVRGAPTTMGASLVPAGAGGRRDVATALAAFGIPSIMIGALITLVPLRLIELGGDGLPIGITFGVAALVGLGIRPLVGRWSDRNGRLRPVRASLTITGLLLMVLPAVSSIPLSSALFVAVLIAIGVLWAPIAAMVFDACDRAGVPQVGGSAGMMIVAALATFAGSIGTNGIAEVVGVGPSVLISGVSALAIAALIELKRHRRPAQARAL